MSYTSTFIQAADDCPATVSVAPATKGKHTSNCSQAALEK